MLVTPMCCHSRKAAVLSPTQIQVLNNIHSLADKTISPLQSIADKLHPLVNYLILPLFAFVNAGVTFGDIGIGALPGIPLAVFLGPVCRKVAGHIPVHLCFCPFASCNDAGRGEQTEPFRGVDVGRYRVHGSPLYRELVFRRDARYWSRAVESGKVGRICRFVYFRFVRLLDIKKSIT